MTADDWMVIALIVVLAVGFAALPSADDEPEKPAEDVLPLPSKTSTTALAGGFSASAPDTDGG